jgi:transcriptional regulator with XRE-family HTH domain
MKMGQLLKKAREAKGDSQQKAAQALGCTEMTYSMWERGVWVPRDRDRLKVIAEYTGERMPVLLGAIGLLEDHEVRKLVPGRRTKSR